MSSEVKARHLLSDYAPTPFKITHADLVLKISEEYTEVSACLSIVQRPGAGPSDFLELDGKNLELQAVRLDGKELPESAYQLTDQKFILKINKPTFQLETVCRIHPEKNLALEGIYQSQGTLSSQCEAEGFRRITYYYDRPDNMAVFRVRLEADRKKYPVLLSNGHCTAKGDLPGGRHYAVWDDPFPKPCYLFAVVAGQLSSLEDKFTTRSGRVVRLSIHSRKEDLDKCHHAMSCLKKAMSWDEEEFGLQCDLNHYQVVAISDFNMGAMENKGLNIFNSSLVLANPDIAMDSSYQDIMAVIGHEYFHNWTGNRVTCRDWFQLCLKEGLTVFRDQEFSGAMYSEAVKRIEEIKLLRQFQWPEDDGPMAHPPRPDSYEEINNFYTATVYNKGAEVVRLLRTLIGKPAFHRGMKLYFEKFDGMAVTQEDFVGVMQEASGQDLGQFFRWYSDPGTPECRVEESFDAKSQTYTLHVSQECKDKKGVLLLPRTIPITTALLDKAGMEISFKTSPSEAACTEKTLIMTEASQSFTFMNVREKPLPSLFRNMSAPVKVKSFLSTKDLIFLMTHDSDPVSVWDAGQTIYQKTLFILIDQFQKNQEPSLPEGILEAFTSVLKKPDFDPAFKSLALKMPSETLLASQATTIDPQAIQAASNWITKTLATAHRKELLNLYESLLSSAPYSNDKKAMGERSLKNTCLQYLALLPESTWGDMISQQFESANNMSDRITALTLLCHNFPDRSKKYLTDYYESWQQEEQAIDHWFSLQASRPSAQPKNIRDLLEHPAFRLENPNRMRSVLSVYCYRNLTGFHHPGGEGYQIATENILKLDAMNRQMAAHLCKAFNSWRKLKTPANLHMEKSLKFLREQKHLSPDLSEVVNRFLEPG